METENVDGYVTTAGFDELVSTFSLEPDPGGSYTLRVTDFDQRVIRELAGHSTVLAALDLAGSLDPREHQVGLDELSSALEAFRC